MLPVLCDAAVYRWRDESGRVHYSDTPQPGAEEVDLPESSVYEAPPIAKPATKPDAKPADEPEAAYRGVWIVAPAAGSSLWANDGAVQVQVGLDPGLQQGHKIRLKVDGREVSATQTSLVVHGITRGSHSLQAEVVSGTGAVLARSNAITFYVHQRSQLNDQGAPADGSLQPRPLEIPTEIRRPQLPRLPGR